MEQLSIIVVGPCHSMPLISRPNPINSSRSARLTPTGRECSTPSLSHGSFCDLRCAKFALPRFVAAACPHFPEQSKLILFCFLARTSRAVLTVLLRLTTSGNSFSRCRRREHRRRSSLEPPTGRIGDAIASERRIYWLAQASSRSRPPGPCLSGISCENSSSPIRRRRCCGKR
jgi:hypothetical protein